MVGIVLAVVAAIVVIAGITFRAKSGSVRAFLQQIRGGGNVAYIWVPPLYQGWQLFVISIANDGTLTLWAKHKGVFQATMTLPRGSYALARTRVQIAPVRFGDGLLLQKLDDATAVQLVLHRDIPSAFFYRNGRSFNEAAQQLETFARQS